MTENNTSIDFSNHVKVLEEKYSNTPSLFQDFKNNIQPFLSEINGTLYFEESIYNSIINLSTNMFFTNSLTVFRTIADNINIGNTVTFDDIQSTDLRDEIIAFSKYIAPILAATANIKAQKDKDFSLATKTLRQGMDVKTLKVFNIIKDWLLKWATYLQREESFSPSTLKYYKQGEVVLVDFGFRVGDEFGGRHYAVVLEKGNNKNSGVILLAPISSYNQFIGQTAKPYNVDLGIGAIHNYAKGSQVIINQIGFYSKLRIESPLSAKQQRIIIPPEKLNEIIDKYTAKFPKKEIQQTD